MKKSRVIADIILFVALIIIFSFYIHVSFFILKKHKGATIFGGVALAFLLTHLTMVNKTNAKIMRELERKETQLQLTQSDGNSQRELLVALRELISTFSGEKDLHTTLRELLLIVKRLLKVDIIFLELYSDEEQKYFARIYEGESDILLCENLRIDVIHKGQSHLINNLLYIPRYKELSEYGYTSLIVVPLMKRSAYFLKAGEKEKNMGMIGALTRNPHDFASKELDLLSAVAAQASLLIENAQLLEKTKYLSITDGLTNLYNHRHFQERLKEEMDRVTTCNLPLSLIIGDIDNFKSYNDNNGHLAGDKVLWKIADILKKNTKGKDVVARYGGEEFVIILSHTKRENAKSVAEKLRQEIQNYQFPGEEKQPQRDLTISFGISSFPDDGKTPDELIQTADKRLYIAKKQGKNQVVWQ